MSRVAKIGFIGMMLVIFFAGSAMAQRFAYIDSDKIQNNYVEFQRALDQFNTEMQAWEDKAAEMEQGIRTMLADYEKQKLILSADKKAEREAKIQAEQQAYQSFTKEIGAPGGRAEQRQRELLEPLYKNVTDAIEKVAVEENYEFVFNSNGLAYAKQELDITDKVLEVLEEGN